MTGTQKMMPRQIRSADFLTIARLSDNLSPND